MRVPLPFSTELIPTNFKTSHKEFRWLLFSKRIFLCCEQCHMARPGPPWQQMRGEVSLLQVETVLYSCSKSPAFSIRGSQSPPLVLSPGKTAIHGTFDQSPGVMACPEANKEVLSWAPTSYSFSLGKCFLQGLPALFYPFPLQSPG